MKNINITEDIIREINNVVFLKPITYNVIYFMLNDNFDRLLGNHELSDKDVDLVKLIQDRGDETTIKIEIDSIFYGKIHVVISSVNGNVFINAIHNDHNVMTIATNEESVRNYVVYKDEDDNTIELTKEVKIGKNDITRFGLTRKENHQAVYQGSLSPVLASMGNKEFFDFTSSLSNKKQSDSLMQKVFNSFTSGSLVGVETGRGTTDLSFYTDVIYNTLENKLEEAKKKQTTKSKAKTRIK